MSKTDEVVTWQVSGAGRGFDTKVSIASYLEPPRSVGRGTCVRSSAVKSTEPRSGLQTAKPWMGALVVNYVQKLELS